MTLKLTLNFLTLTPRESLNKNVLDFKLNNTKKTESGHHEVTLGVKIIFLGKNLQNKKNTGTVF